MAQPRPCTYPAQFTGQTHMFNYHRGVMGRGLMAVDQEGERTFEVEEFTGEDALFERLTLYKQDRTYSIHRATRSCTYAPIPPRQKWAPFAVPKNASFYREATLGIPGASFVVNEFGIEHAPRGRGGKYTVWQQVTVRECMPVTTHVFATEADGRVNVSVSLEMFWQNVVLGIEDPDVFIPPSNCRPGPHPGPSTPAPGVSRY